MMVAHARAPGRAAAVVLPVALALVRSPLGLAVIAGAAVADMRASADGSDMDSDANAGRGGGRCAHQTQCKNRSDQYLHGSVLGCRETVSRLHETLVTLHTNPPWGVALGQRPLHGMPVS